VRHLQLYGKLYKNGFLYNMALSSFYIILF
jgi:hypothetical protein